MGRRGSGFGTVLKIARAIDRAAQQSAKDRERARRAHEKAQLKREADNRREQLRREKELERQQREREQAAKAEARRIEQAARTSEKAQITAIKKEFEVAAKKLQDRAAERSAYKIKLIKEYLR